MVPTATNIGLLVNPTSRNLAEAQTKDLRAAARIFGLEIHVLHASGDGDLDNVFASLARLQISGLVITADSFLYSRREQLGALAARYTMPAIYPFREHTEAGGLMSYGGNLSDSYRLTGTYAGRVLKGEKPAELPVQQATKIELVINLRTAKSLGLTVPPGLLVAADEVIE